MCQGRRIRYCTAWCLLIAGAIQGITPDARDMSSAFAMRVILAEQAGPGDFRGEDDPRDEVCLAANPLAPCREWWRHPGARSASLAGTSGRPVDPVASMVGPESAPSRVWMPAPGLPDAPCRLRC